MSQEKRDSGVPQQFVVWQHNHAGWRMSKHEADSADDALKASVYHWHEWLPEFSHTLKIEDDRYIVDYTGEPRRVALGRVQHAGYWFSDKVRIGKEDDCSACGGTGIDHYNPFNKCWKCKGETNAE